MDRTQQVAAIGATVERIAYDATSRQISIRFHLAGSIWQRARGRGHERQ
jgi:hypothetical protein